MRVTHPFFLIIAVLCPLMLAAQGGHPMMQRPAINGKEIEISYS